MMLFSNAGFCFFQFIQRTIKLRISIIFGMCPLLLKLLLKISPFREPWASTHDNRLDENRHRRRNQHLSHRALYETKHLVVSNVQY